jgi:hypothetical protein
MIKNKINNKVYIGITTLEDVVKNRYSGSIENTHNIHLKNAIYKYGVDGFDVSTIYFAYSKSDLESKEIECIRIYNANDKNFGYNVCDGGEGVHGYVTPEETKKILSEKSKEMWDNHPEYKENLRKRNTGESNPLVKKGGHSRESREKMSKSKKLLIEQGEISLEKAFIASQTPEARRKSVINKSKYWFIQYDENHIELNRWHTLKDMYEYMIKNNIETNITYAGLKNKDKQCKMFSDKIYKGFYWEKIKK